MITKTSFSHLVILGSTIPDVFKYVHKVTPASIQLNQKTILKKILRDNTACEYGVKHNFKHIKNYDDFVKNVPIVTYEQLHPLILKQINQEAPVLVTSKPARYHPTSGTSFSSKLIPYTKQLSREYSRGINVWLNDLYNCFPALKKGLHFWSISPKIQPVKYKEITNHNAVIGFDDDAQYLGWKDFIVRSTMATSSELRLIDAFDDFRYALLLSLLRCNDLSLISVWSPSYLQLLFEAVIRYGDRLVYDLYNGTMSISNQSVKLKCSTAKPDKTVANSLKSWLSDGLPDFAELTRSIWKNLQLVSFWCDGPSKNDALKLSNYFPHATVQPKGICATEGMISLPIERFGGCIPAFMSHFLEFKPLDSNEPVLADHLIAGKQYSVIMTTGGGFYRYALGDIIKVLDTKKGVPIIQFVGRNMTCDFVGEKLHELEVSGIIDNIKNIITDKIPFCFLAPEKNSSGKIGYTMFLESNSTISPAVIGKIQSLLETMLCENIHYKYALQIGQLAPVNVFQIQTNGIALFYKRLQKEGKRAGDIKLTSLDRRTGWTEWFTNNNIEISTI